MAKITYKINNRDVKNLEKKIDSAVDTSTEDTFAFFKNKTPVAGGNARRRTKYKETSNKAVINADYPYADRLDNGYSKQAPQGMSKPSIKFLTKKLKQEFRKI